ncbi:hypothetical protein JGU66_07610 [Myxococcaceae bacterium JPH2]|nr:hypothetical protein [Myxococcaceae bacterium JPH2]
MKNWKQWTVAVLGSLALAGCGDSKPPVDTPDTTPPPTNGGSSPVGDDDSVVQLNDNQYEVRILGTSAKKFQGAFINVDSMTVTANGTPLPVEMKSTVMDLARTDHAFLVGLFTLPPGTDSAQVVIRLDEFGGFDGANGPSGVSGPSGALDVRTAPIRFEVTRALLTPRRHAVVQVDLSRSVVSQRAGDTLLLPSTVVAY